jgi:hypothetical protein
MRIYFLYDVYTLSLFQQKIEMLFHDILEYSDRQK